MNTLAGGLVAYGLAGLRYSGGSIVIYMVVLCIHALISNQLQIFCVWVTPNQVRHKEQLLNYGKQVSSLECQ